MSQSSSHSDTTSGPGDRTNTPPEQPDVRLSWLSGWLCWLQPPSAAKGHRSRPKKTFSAGAKFNMSRNCCAPSPMKCCTLSAFRDLKPVSTTSESAAELLCVSTPIPALVQRADLSPSTPMSTIPCLYTGVARFIATVKRLKIHHACHCITMRDSVRCMNTPPGHLMNHRQLYHLCPTQQQNLNVPASFDSLFPISMVMAELALLSTTTPPHCATTNPEHPSLGTPS